MAKLVKVKVRAGRKFHHTVGEGDARETKTFQGGEVVEVTESQMRNFADLFEDPNAAVGTGTAENLTAEEAAALTEFRQRKAKEAEEAKLKATTTPNPAGTKVDANDGSDGTGKTADEAPAAKAVAPAPKK